MYILSIKRNNFTPATIIPYMTKSGALLHKEKLERNKFNYESVVIKRVKTIEELDCMEEI